MEKMSQSTEIEMPVWPIGQVISCALSDNICSCNQTRSLRSTAATASVRMR